uniref:rhomboid protease n=1 Tax=Trichobilharzia regenti TaxID=157069 RepID=A0AA85JEA4_TRIRE|nr:unnamed protein product [Trichobilharzia regenti]
MITLCSRSYQRFRLIYQNCRPYAFGRTGFSRKKASIQTPVHSNGQFSPASKLGLVVKCGAFTVISTNAIFVGSLILGFEAWRSRRAKSKYRENKSFVSRVCEYLEGILGRPLRASDMYWALLACNVLIYLGLNSAFSSTLLRYFCSSPYGPTPVLSMILSVFSHRSFFHLAINMYVLHSFAPSIISLIGVEDFFSLFIAGGIFSNYVSLINKVLQKSTFPSLGASGGICAIIGAFSMLQPNARLCIPFVVDIIPHSFQASNAIWVMLCIETLGILFFTRRSALDHAAHAGGLLFGMVYGMNGSEFLCERRRAVLSWWRSIRDSK